MDTSPLRKKGEEEEEEEEGDGGDEHNVSNPDPYYPPIIYLPEVIVNSGEDDEEELVKLRGKLYRYAHECSPPEWKERGTGDAKILQNKEAHTCRIVMRRDKTLKLCANHFILPWMELKKNANSDKAFVWKTQADFADQEAKQETLAIRFSTAENARRWQQAFERARNYVVQQEAARILREEDEMAGKLKDMTVQEEGSTKTPAAAAEGDAA